jgi:hypothetical protein
MSQIDVDRLFRLRRAGRSVQDISDITGWDIDVLARILREPDYNTSGDIGQPPAAGGVGPLYWYGDFDPEKSYPPGAFIEWQRPDGSMMGLYVLIGTETMPPGFDPESQESPGVDATWNMLTQVT